MLGGHIIGCRLKTNHRLQGWTQTLWKVLYYESCSDHIVKARQAQVRTGSGRGLMAIGKCARS